MSKKIKVQIFGNKDEVLKSGCGCRNKGSNSCTGCSNSKKKCNGCSSIDSQCLKDGKKTLKNAYIDLEKYIYNSDIKNNTELEFIELNNFTLEKEEYYKIKEIIDRGFVPPITVIDDIIRYYGGISNILIHKDVKELIE